MNEECWHIFIYYRTLRQWDEYNFTQDQIEKFLHSIQSNEKWIKIHLSKKIRYKEASLMINSDDIARIIIEKINDQ